ncbi:hypothetical protein BG011_005795 [Mortierella polycephala]|uniref:Uncharacterized protein n=1 Tax=Mortierella polycephala TaxID=41804 RepID=A0A9P6PXT8_9FUNG|nr:hypothetical protein BG011_005795 [Mortierella polycephala]
MFARPVDPFLAFNSVYSAAELAHKDMFAQEQQPRHQDLQQEQRHASRRKRSLHFEPEFFEALNSSLQDPPATLSRSPRPYKRSKRNATDATSSFAANNTNTPPADPPSTSTASDKLSPATLVELASGQNTTKARSPSPTFSSFSVSKPTDSPCIIDLSSGEELQALNLGENDHKRRRENTTDSGSSTETLREVFDVQNDGSLHAVMDHAPSLPSPTKRIKTDNDSKSKHRTLWSLNEQDDGREHRHKHRQSLHHHSDAAWRTYPNMTAKDNIRTGSSTDEHTMDQNSWLSTPTYRANAMALVRYKGPKTVTFVDGVDELIRHQLDDHYTPALDNAQGNELILYRRPAHVPLSSQATDDDAEEPSACIEELDDGYGTDNAIHELEEKIMDMDLD